MGAYALADRAGGIGFVSFPRGVAIHRLRGRQTGCGCDAGSADSWWDLSREDQLVGRPDFCVVCAHREGSPAYMAILRARYRFVVMVKFGAWGDEPGRSAGPGVEGAGKGLFCSGVNRANLNRWELGPRVAWALADAGEVV